MKPNILLVDDDVGIQFGFTKYLSKAGYTVQPVSNLAEARKAVSTQRFDAVLLDLLLPDGNGIDWITDLRENYPDIAIIIITGVSDIPMAVEAMRKGADNLLTKPVNMSDLEVFLKKSLELEILRKNQIVQKRLKKKEELYFGDSPAMKKVFELVSVAAGNDSTVLLQGETGTGKGVLAHWIHNHSHLREKTFVEVNCSNLRGELLASELFGHARGAFTSAVQDQRGLIEVADGGTLFLDEIVDMDLKVQSQFLKVIEEKRYRRLGDVKVRRSEFRLICATNQNLLEATRQKRFRQDLYFRLNIFPIFIPPLRDRSEDIPNFIYYMLRDMGIPDLEISKEIMQMLIAYQWPGNIREVKNVLERARLLAQGASLTAEHFPGLDASSQLLTNYTDKVLDLDNAEKIYIKSVLKRFGGDTKKVAKALGVSRATLYRKLKKFQKTK